MKLNWYVIVSIFLTAIICIFLGKLFWKKSGQIREDWCSSNGLMDANAKRCVRQIERIPESKRSYTEEFILDQIDTVNRADQNDVYIESNLDRLKHMLQLMRNSPHVNPNIARNDEMEIHPLFVLDRIQPRLRGEDLEAAHEFRKQMCSNIKNKNLNSIDDVLDGFVVHTSDPQNVHDSSVNMKIKSSIDTIKGIVVDENEINENVEECIEHVLSRSIDEADRKRLNIALSELRKGSYNGTYNMNEDALLSLIWKRTKHPVNVIENRSSNLKECIVDAIRDMVVDDGRIVCSGGRCARLVASLTYVDHDDTLGNPRTVENLREIIIERTKDILHAKIEQARLGTEEMQGVADYYMGLESDADNAAKVTFEKTLIRDIDDMINEYSQELRDDDKENIRQFCHSAIE